MALGKAMRAGLAVVAGAWLTLLSVPVFANAKVNLCNSGDTELKAALLLPDNTFVWEDEWLIAGWYTIAPDDCYSVQVRDKLYVGLGYTDIEGNFGFMRLKGQNAGSDANFCVHPTEVFDREAPFAAHRTCPAGYAKAPFQLYFVNDRMDLVGGGTFLGTIHDQFVRFSKRDRVHHVLARPAGAIAQAGRDGRDGGSPRAAPGDREQEAAHAKAPARQGARSVHAECLAAHGCIAVRTKEGRIALRPFGKPDWSWDDGSPVSSYDRAALETRGSDLDLARVAERMNALIGARSFEALARKYREGSLLFGPAGTYWGEMVYPAEPLVVLPDGRLGWRAAYVELRESGNGKTTLVDLGNHVFAFDPADLDFARASVDARPDTDAWNLTLRCKDGSGTTGPREPSRCIDWRTARYAERADEDARYDFSNEPVSYHAFAFETEDEARQALALLASHWPGRGRPTEGRFPPVLLLLSLAGLAILALLIRRARRARNVPRALNAD